MWYVIIFFFTLFRVSFSLYLKLPAYKPVSIYLGRSYLYPSLGILIWAAKMLPGVENKGNIQNFKNVIPGSVHLETN